MNRLESGHFGPEDYARFIEEYREGRISGELERHLVRREDCLDVFGLIVLAERPATAEEEAILPRARSLPNAWCFPKALARTFPADSYRGSRNA